MKLTKKQKEIIYRAAKQKFHNDVVHARRTIFNDDIFKNITKTSNP